MHYFTINIPSLDGGSDVLGGVMWFVYATVHFYMLNLRNERFESTKPRYGCGCGTEIMKMISGYCNLELLHSFETPCTLIIPNE